MPPRSAVVDVLSVDAIPFSTHTHSACAGRSTDMSKVCAVVGVGPGLGGSVASRFARAGYSVVLMARKESSVEGTLKRISGEGGKAAFVPCDVTDEASVKAAFSGIGDVHVLVFNVSGPPTSTSVLSLRPGVSSLCRACRTD